MQIPKVSYPTSDYGFSNEWMSGWETGVESQRSTDSDLIYGISKIIFDWIENSGSRHWDLVELLAEIGIENPTRKLDP